MPTKICHSSTPTHSLMKPASQYPLEILAAFAEIKILDNSLLTSPQMLKCAEKDTHLSTQLDTKLGVVGERLVLGVLLAG